MDGITVKHPSESVDWDDIGTIYQVQATDLDGTVRIDGTCEPGFYYTSGGLLGMHNIGIHWDPLGNAY